MTGGNRSQVRGPAGPPQSHPRPADPAATAQELLAVLVEIKGLHDQLLAVAEEHRAALRAADGASVERCVRREVSLAEAASRLDSRRSRLARALLDGLVGASAGAGRDATLAQLAPLIPEPVRSRVSEAAAALRVTAGSVRGRFAVLHAATQSLAAHAEGLVRQVAASLSHARTYGRGGACQAGVTHFLNVLDVRT
ncbi:MAG: flagellar export chaperone FlgN [Phycisphaerae bacterium]|nr:flagellar export chaperone FlgN [Phycisphaerae bacterium]